MMFIYFLFFILGTTVGSFLNVVIDRCPANKKLTGRSHCDYCGYQLKWFDLIPILSFLFLRGKCRKCQRRLSWQYPLVELLTGLVFVLLFKNFLAANSVSWSYMFSFIYYLLVSCLLIVIGIIDWKTFLIFDWMVYGGIILTLIWQAFNGNFWNHFYSALLASAFFWALVIFSREKWMGIGDAKLVFWLGWLLGFPQILLSLFLAFFSGAIIGIGLIIFKGKNLKTQVPFGPFLCFSTLIVLLWQPTVLQMMYFIY